MVQNSEGEPVDPVPFVVVTGMFFLVCYSFFPVYFLSLGVGLPAGLALTTSIFLALAAGAYNRLVRSFRPEVRRRSPQRFDSRKSSTTRLS
ncbi:hypothetical protein [Halovenus salina]|uniref:Uncharacterized protein n=1 Tax=Halovenus salina TaxID=1510225 RepID=A0ABD5W178_9EURY